MLVNMDTKNYNNSEIIGVNAGLSCIIRKMSPKSFDSLGCNSSSHPEVLLFLVKFLFPGQVHVLKHKEWIENGIVGPGS